MIVWSKVNLGPAERFGVYLRGGTSHRGKRAVIT